MHGKEFFFEKEKLSKEKFAERKRWGEEWSAFSAALPKARRTAQSSAKTKTLLQFWTRSPSSKATRSSFPKPITRHCGISTKKSCTRFSTSSSTRNGFC